MNDQIIKQHHQTIEFTESCQRKKQMEADYYQVDKSYPLANTGGSSGLFFAFLRAAGLGEGDVDIDRDL